MDLGLAGRPCLVTGASVGVGVARVMAAERPLVIVADLTTKEAPAMIRDAELGAFGRLDILINNAGGSRPMIADAPDDQWDDAFDLNVTATPVSVPGEIG